MAVAPSNRNRFSFLSADSSTNLRKVIIKHFVTPFAFFLLFRTDYMDSPDCFADTSEHVRFFTFLFSIFLLVGSVR